MKKRLIYVYCISGSPPGKQEFLESKGLEIFRAHGFYMVIKRVSGDEFSEENLKRIISDMQWLEPQAREHISTITEIMKDCALIPFKFGTIFQSEENLAAFAGSYADSLTENLTHIDKMEEWAVKVYSNRKVIINQIDELSQDAANLETLIMASSPGKAFLLKIKKNDVIENEISRLRKMFGQEFFNELEKLSNATRLNNIYPKEFTGRNDDMILNAAFLVNKAIAKDFTSTVKMLKIKKSDVGFDFDVSGPWPPFSFISIKEK